ncbi:hypothetical protein HOBO_200 [Bacillus phage Hobo]|uniref:Uncharacterized protein n=2 Tax=Caeruleovirus BM15 TaxID=1985178 RepID=A0A0S2MUT0_9CAUD|nr:hypothetical protein FD732_gp141 [Bacillus phage BM15]ALO79608.1 hypothetical protein BM10_204 [Bacillus phage BM15]AXQ66956.1 hypothetical protein HOBO_200 [Bacillus phage Hobo]
MTKLSVGTPTPYKDKNGRVVKIGDRVELEGMYFEVTQNDFTDEIVIDGDTGMESLQKISYMCEVISFSQFSTLPEAIDLSLSSKYKDADDVLRNIWELRNKFVAKYGKYVMHNTVYLGENLVTLLNDNHPYTNSVADVFGMRIVEVRETDHMSLGLTVTKH